MPRARVLVVEDDGDLRELLAMALQLEGYLVEAAVDAIDGLVRLEFFPRPDVVVTDLLMPVVTGQDLVQVLRRDPRYAGIPILVVTAATVPVEVSKAVDGVLTKPFELEHLLEAVETLIARSAPTSTPRPAP